MRELNVRLPTQQPRPRGALWRATFFFLVSFLAVFMGSALMLDHAAALLG